MRGLELESHFHLIQRPSTHSDEAFDAARYDQNIRHCWQSSEILGKSRIQANLARWIQWVEGRLME